VVTYFQHMKLSKYNTTYPQNLW